MVVFLLLLSCPLLDGQSRSLSNDSSHGQRQFPNWVAVIVAQIYLMLRYCPQHFPFSRAQRQLLDLVNECGIFLG